MRFRIFKYIECLITADDIKCTEDSRVTIFDGMTIVNIIDIKKQRIKTSL